MISRITRFLWLAIACCAFSVVLCLFLVREMFNFAKQWREYQHGRWQKRWRQRHGEYVRSVQKWQRKRNHNVHMDMKKYQEN